MLLDNDYLRTKAPQELLFYLAIWGIKIEIMYN